MKHIVEVLTLSDDKLSVKVDGFEVCILPSKKECTAINIEEAIEKVLEHLDIEECTW